VHHHTVITVLPLGGKAFFGPYRDGRLG